MSTKMSLKMSIKKGRKGAERGQKDLIQRQMKIIKD